MHQYYCYKDNHIPKEIGILRRVLDDAVIALSNPLKIIGSTQHNDRQIHELWTRQVNNKISFLVPSSFSREKYY